MCSPWGEIDRQRPRAYARVERTEGDVESVEGGERPLFEHGEELVLVSRSPAS